MRQHTFAIVALIIAAIPAAAQEKGETIRLSEGVYLIRHADNGDGFASGNTTVIIGERQVLVVDPGLLPATAREDIAQIRRWTNKPIAFVVNTHFHSDHNRANSTYLDSFPAATIVAHAETKHDMDILGPGAIPLMEASIGRWTRWVATGKMDNGRVLTAPEMAAYKDALVKRTPATMDDFRRARYQPPTLVFDDRFTVDLGNRIVELSHLGRGNTAGDIVAYLPAEKMAIAGDLVVHPMPYIFDGYPAEWSRTLDRLSRMDVTTIVPGHGPPLRDMAYVSLLRDVMRSAVDQIGAAITRVGPAMFRSVEDVRPLVDLSRFRARFAGTDPDLGAAFDAMVVNLVNVAFKEASLR